jgi:hypothetical protein
VKTFSFRMVNNLSEMIETAARLNGMTPQIWIEKLVLAAAYEEWETDIQRRREAARRASKIIPFPVAGHTS